MPRSAAVETCIVIGLALASLAPASWADEESLAAAIAGSMSENPNVRQRALRSIIDREARDPRAVRALWIALEAPISQRLRQECESAIQSSSEVALDLVLAEIHTTDSISPRAWSWLSRLARRVTPDRLVAALPALIRDFEYGRSPAGALDLLAHLGELARPATPVLEEFVRSRAAPVSRWRVALYLQSIDGAESEPARGYLAWVECNQALFWAALDGDLGGVQSAIASGAEIDWVAFKEWTGCTTNRTALMAAAQGGHLEIVRELIRHRPDLEHRDDGQTALRLAIRYDRPEIERVLIAAGAREDPGAIRSAEALLTAACEGFELAPGDPYPAYPGVRGSTGPSLELAELLAGGADPNSATGSGITALMFAANLGLTRNVRMLLRHGADPFRESPEGLTAMILASREGRTEVMEILANAGVPEPPPFPVVRGELDRVLGTAFPLVEVSFRTGSRPQTVEIRDEDDQRLHTIEDPRDYSIREICILPGGAIKVVRETTVSSVALREGPPGGLRDLGGSRRSHRGTILWQTDLPGVFQVLRADGTVQFQRTFGDGFTVTPAGELQLERR